MKAWTGREATLPIDLILPGPKDGNENENEMVHTTMKRFQEMYAYMRRKQAGQIRRNARSYTGQKSIFSVGDWVWYFSTRRGAKPSKIVNAWVGPYQVLEELNQVLVRISPALFTGREIVAHITRLRLYQAPRGENLGNTPDTEEDLVPMADEEAEAIEAEIDATQAQLPVSIATPEAEIEDLPHLRKKRGRPPQMKESTAQTNPEVIKQPEDTPTHDASVEMEAPPHEESTEMEATEERNKREGGLLNKIADLTKKVKMYRKRDRREAFSSGDEATPRKVEGRISIPWRELDRLSSGDESIETIIQISNNSDEPTRGSHGAAGYDVRAQTSVKLEAGKVTKVPLKLSMAIPSRFCVMITGRSGLATQGIYCHTGIIDSDFRGQVAAILLNTTGRDFDVARGQRIAQALVVPVVHTQWRKVDHLSNTGRNKDGFGSTGSH